MLRGSAGGIIIAPSIANGNALLGGKSIGSGNAQNTAGGAGGDGGNIGSGDSNTGR